jgi:hypothetical protein
MPSPEEEREKLKELVINIYRRLERNHGPDHYTLVEYRRVARQAGFIITPGIGTQSSIIIPGS